MPPINGLPGWLYPPAGAVMQLGTLGAAPAAAGAAWLAGSFTATAVVKTWTAPGTGPVKTVELIQAGGKTELTTIEELLTFTRG